MQRREHIALLQQRDIRRIGHVFDKISRPT
jgi:hypothetical protein